MKNKKCTLKIVIVLCLMAGKVFGQSTFREEITPLNGILKLKSIDGQLSPAGPMLYMFSSISSGSYVEVENHAEGKVEKYPSSGRVVNLAYKKNIDYVKDSQNPELLMAGAYMESASSEYTIILNISVLGRLITTMERWKVITNTEKEVTVKRFFIAEGIDPLVSKVYVLQKINENQIKLPFKVYEFIDGNGL